MVRRTIPEPAKAEELLTHYLQACDEHGKEPRPVIRKDVIILEDGEKPGNGISDYSARLPWYEKRCSHSR